LKNDKVYKEFLFAQFFAGIAAVISGVVGLTMIYKMDRGFFSGLFSLLGSKVAAAGLAIIILNLVISYFGLKGSFNKINNIPGAKLMITIVTFVWMTIVTILAGAVWL
jgi:hypothetical protein